MDLKNLQKIKICISKAVISDLTENSGITETVQIWKIFLTEGVMNVNVYLKDVNVYLKDIGNVHTKSP